MTKTAKVYISGVPGLHEVTVSDDALHDITGMTLECRPNGSYGFVAPRGNVLGDKYSRSISVYLYGVEYANAYHSWDAPGLNLTRDAYVVSKRRAQRALKQGDRRSLPKTTTRVTAEDARAILAAQLPAPVIPVARTPAEMIAEIRLRRAADLQVGEPVVIKHEPAATTAFKEIFAQLFGNQLR